MAHDIIRVTKYWRMDVDGWATHAAYCGCEKDEHFATWICGESNSVDISEDLYLEQYRMLDRWKFVPDDEVPDHVWAALAMRAMGVSNEPTE